ncbi:MAG: SpoIVB peptidase S55 domain-containing protein [Synergistaceae bacterium]|nr:SpoIVB peptidase S55 domain-containing protein [Synergistaceae bacterium]
MKKKLFLAALAALIVLSCGAAWGSGKFVPTDPVMPLAEIKPGMTGYARTVFSGTRISSFKVTVLGVLPSKRNPQNLILIRVDDEYVRENGGIAAGMSGSPVYVNGRLIGAIGYGWSFADSNLGLVTPIEEMARAMERPEKIPWFDIPALPAEKPLSEDKKENSLSEDKEEEAAATPAHTSEVSAEAVSGEPEMKMMPLMVDGISDRMAKRLGDRLGLPVAPLGVSASQGNPVNLKWKPEPGAAVGAAVAWGDFSAGGIGTLTAISKDGKFLAFAHPMFNKGDVSYALTDANIIKIIPSLSSSFKLGYMNQITGIVTQDRPEAIGGRLGQLAAASSYTVRFKNIDDGQSAAKRFQTVADPFIGPEVGAAGILGIIDNLWAQNGEGTALLTYSVSGGNLSPAWKRRNIFYSPEDVVKSMQKELDALGKILSLNPFRAISPYGVTAEVELTKTPRVVYIEKIEIEDEKASYKPGDKVKVKATFRPWRKAPVVRSFELTVPENAMLFCEITVRGGGIEEPPQEPLITGVRALTSFDELLNELNAKETNNQIIVEISGPENEAKKRPKAGADKEKAAAVKIPSGGSKEKKPEQGREKPEQKKGGKESFSPADLLEDRFVSEIKAERIKDGSMVIADTNSYIEGVLRTFIRIKSPASGAEISDRELARIIAEKSREAAKEEEEADNGELPEEDDGEDEENIFSILTQSGRD